MKFYGNINNRVDENCYFGDTYGNIKVGTPCTVYLWSDRHAYEVIEVKGQDRLVIRRLKAIRTDDYGMSDMQEYEYKSNPTAEPEEIKLAKNGWRNVSVFNLEKFDKLVHTLMKDTATKEDAEKRAEFYWRQALTEKQFEKVLAGKEVIKLLDKINISFGVADEFYDYSF